MSLSPAAHDPSVAEDGDTSPTELGRKMRERPYANALSHRGRQKKNVHLLRHLAEHAHRLRVLAR